MIKDLEQLYSKIRTTRKATEEDDSVPFWVWHDLLQIQDTLRAIIDESICPVCHNTGTTFDTVEQRDVPCGGIDCTVTGDDND